MCAMPYTQSFDSNIDHPVSKSFVSRVASILAFLWRWFIGVVFCQSIILCVMVVGWTYRLMQRYAVYCLVKSQNKKHATLAFSKLTRTHPELQYLQSPPNWFFQQNAKTTFNEQWHNADTLWQSIKALFRFPLHSVWLNFKIGIQAVFNTYVFTLVPCLLWQFAWHAGWNNSFNKVYEQSFVGATTGVTGIILFCLIMFYVPMAQARQAVTGEWRSFYHFRANWRLIQSSWLYYTILIALFSLISLPITIIKIAPGFIGHAEHWMNAGDAEILQFLNRYYFWTGFICFAGYVIVHLFAVRVYVSALMSALHHNQFPLESLSPFERTVIKATGADQNAELDESSILVQIGRWLGTKLKAALCMILIFMFWLTFVLQIYVSEFLNYHTHLRAWMNQPLIQLPAFRYVPTQLEERVKESHHNEN